jgi:DNA repair exonuclease SbcCD ATPase subunit
MKIGALFNTDAADRPSAGGGTPRASATKTGDMAVLVRVLPPGAADLALSVLDNGQVHKLATITAELEALKSAVLLQAVPTTPQEAHRVADVIKQAKTAVDELERARTARVKPLNDEVKRVNGLFRLVTEQLEGIRARADRLVIAHAQAERARIQREQEELQRQQREAAEREAEALRKAETAKTEKARKKALEQAEAASQEIAQIQVVNVMPAPTAYRNDAGTVSLTKRVVLAAFDPDKVPLQYWRSSEVLEALRKVLAKAVRGGARDIPGCTLEEKEGTAALP